VAHNEFFLILRKNSSTDLNKTHTILQDPACALFEIMHVHTHNITPHIVHPVLLTSNWSGHTGGRRTKMISKWTNN